MAPIFKGQPELMATISHFNGPTIRLTSILTQPLPIFPRRQRTNFVQISFSSSPSSFSFSFSFSSVPCLSLMASSSGRSAKGCGGTFPGKGGPFIAGGMTAKGSEDNSGSSDSVLGSPEPLGDMLGRLTVDAWYRSGERFPSVPASLQPPPADWEWLVMREDAAADVA